MDFKTLEQLWASNANSLSQTAEAYVLADTMKTFDRRRAAVTRALWAIGLVLAVWTVVGVRAIVLAKIDLSREWSAALMLGIAWLAFAKVGADYRRHLKAVPDAGATLPDALRALLDEAQVRQGRAKVLAVFTLVLCIAVALAVWQLHTVGKMTMRNVVQGAMLFGSGLLLSAIVQAIVYVSSIRPEGARLRRLLQAYENDPSIG
jgi:hypothetical protein